MATRSRASGFTLIELLLSIAIMGMVVGIATYGFSLFARDWDGRSGGFDAALGAWQRLTLIEGCLSDSLPWLVRDTNGGLGYYFLGRDEGLTFITSSPVFAFQSIAVVRLFRERQIDGRWRLVYEEAPMIGQLLKRAEQRLRFSKRMVILKDTSSLSFQYLGWSSIEAREAELPQWWNEYDGMRTYQNPLKVAMIVDGHRSFFELPDRADAALQAVRAD